MSYKMRIFLKYGLGTTIQCMSWSTLAPTCVLRVPLFYTSTRFSSCIYLVSKCWGLLNSWFLMYNQALTLTDPYLGLPWDDFWCAKNLKFIYNSNPNASWVCAPSMRRRGTRRQLRQKRRAIMVAVCTMRVDCNITFLLHFKLRNFTTYCNAKGTIRWKKEETTSNILMTDLTLIIIMIMIVIMIVINVICFQLDKRTPRWLGF